MPTVDVVVESPVHDSFRVQQVAGMFDVPLADKCREEFSVELPGQEEVWQIGLIVGPSGSGKSTIAREAFGEALYESSDWPADRAVIDCFDDLPVRKVVELLTAVGFSSPPGWVKPYGVLSNGERFRCDLARGMAKGEGTESKSNQSAIRNPKSEIPLVVFDEFTSVVDRTVAKVCSAAISKGIKAGRIGCRFVGVTCHNDVVEWLEPDWVLEMATGRLTRRCLRRPVIELEIHRTGLKAWRLFAPHHYLSGSLNMAARCYLASWNGEPVSFCATLSTIARHDRRRFTRIVTLPDYQGIGIGMRMVRAVAEMERAEGYRVSVTTSHPAMIGHCKGSPLWRATSIKKRGRVPNEKGAFAHYRDSAGRAVVSFEFVGDLGFDRKQTSQPDA